MSNIQEILESCIALAPTESIFRKAVPVLYVDGTACTKKSSTLARTGLRVDKIQKTQTFKNMDSYGPTMLGYICSGMVQQANDLEPRVIDSPLNVLEWHILWKLIDLFVLKFGNCAPHFAESVESSIDNYVGDDNDLDGSSINTMLDFTRKFDYIFYNLQDSYYYKHFRSQLNTVVFIDSNISRCDSLHRKRNVGSDMVRSEWKFYTILQNRMYSVLYPHECIDLAWFSACDSDIMTAMSMYVESVLDGLVERASRTIQQNNSILVRITPPTTSVDYTLANITTHTYRTLARIGCKSIVNASTDTSDDDLKQMQQQVPKYLNIKLDRNVTLQTAKCKSLANEH
uniref:GrBNV_gp44-like protein n=1 Tax=Nilaparvata lugens endogenous nudivirus TaxID=1487700 RepID=X5G6M9_9VIRU|nr:GrBNV_gp44-like protein [Nilaparvata lugens endogenous nudivirus]